MRPSWSTRTIGLPVARLSSIAARIFRSTGATMTSQRRGGSLSGLAVGGGELARTAVERHADGLSVGVELDANAPRRSRSTSPFFVAQRRGWSHQRAAAQHVERVHVLDELGDVIVGGPQQDILGGAALDDPAALHDGDAVADLERLVEVVADEDDGLLQLASAARAARPAACRGSADRAPRTARPSAGCRRRWRRRGRGRRAAACRRTARGRTCSAHCVEADQGQLLVDDRGRARPWACRAARGRSRHSRARCARAAARTAGTPWRRGCVRSMRSVVRRRRWRRRSCGPRARPGPAPRATLLRPLTARSSVDLPEPDRPISTQISPCSTVRLTPAAPSTAPVCGQDLVARRALVEQRQRLCAALAPKTMSTLLEFDGRVMSGPRSARSGACRRGRA